MVIPERIGRYRIDRELGRGCMGVVYAAHDERLQRPVAVLTIAEAVPDEQTRKRFRREARTAARVHHPNVCRIYEIGEHGDELFIAMEFLEGESQITVTGIEATPGADPRWGAGVSPACRRQRQSREIRGLVACAPR